MKAKVCVKKERRFIPPGPRIRSLDYVQCISVTVTLSQCAFKLHASLPPRPQQSTKLLPLF